MTTDLEEHLDAQIAHVRNEIAALRAQKQRLSTALLGSNRVQKQLSARKASSNSDKEIVSQRQKRLSEAFEIENVENITKVHKLGFGVTAFPFTDTAPSRTAYDHPSGNMLGVRIDLHSIAGETGKSEKRDNDGEQNAPMYQSDAKTERHEEEHDTIYIILFRRLQHNNTTYLKIHQHNIPKHIDVGLYSEKYLLLPSALEDRDEDSMEVEANPQTNPANTTGEEDSFQDDSGIDLTMTEDTEANATAAYTNIDPTPSIQNNNQSLHTFITSVHDDLRSWHYRVRYIAFLHSTLCPSANGASQNKLTIHDLQRTTNDARNMQIIWANGTLGLLKLDYEGLIERAVVYGPSPHSSLRTEGEESDSELNGSSASDIDDESPPATYNASKQHSRSAPKDQTATDGHVRLHTIERLLMYTKSGIRIRIQDLLEQLKLIEQEFENPT